MRNSVAKGRVLHVVVAGEEEDVATEWLSSLSVLPCEGLLLSILEVDISLLQILRVFPGCDLPRVLGQHRDVGFQLPWHFLAKRILFIVEDSSILPPNSRVVDELRFDLFGVLAISIDVVLGCFQVGPQPA